MNDHDGEKDLVLGNKQLLAIFFVATLLCGVFFAMGYVVGGNSAKSAAAAASSAANDSATAPIAEGKREQPAAAPNEVTPPPKGDGGSVSPDAEPKVADNPAAAGAQPPPIAAAPPAATTPAVAKPAAPFVTPGAVGSAAASAPASVYLSAPEAGASYWQVAAPTRPAADVLVKSLRDRGLPAILAPSSKPGLFEVLVGPYRSALTLADAKKKLTDLGFDGLIVHKQAASQ